MARRLLLLAELEVLAPLDLELLLGLARLALQSKHDLFGRLRLLVEDGLRLAAEAHLLRVVPSLALREVTGLAGLVLRHLEDLVVLGPQNQRLALSQVATLDYGLSYSIIKRVNRRRVINVTANVDSTQYRGRDIWTP